MMWGMCRGRVWKASLLLLAMSAVLMVSTAAASPAHHHSALAGGDCDLCCLWHSPALQSPHLSDLRPSIILHWQASAEERQASLDPQIPPALGRAPPV